MRAAVVILNYNGKEMLRQFLPSVIEHSISDIIIIDNKSTDDSVDFLKSHYPELKLIFTENNTGYAGGYNAGLFTIGDQYEYFILLNSDVEVTPDWDKTILDFLDKHHEVAAAQPKILSFPNKNYFDYAGASGGYLDRLGYPFCRGRILHTVEEDLQQYDDVIEVDWASGACLFIRSKVFLEMGGFENIFFAHMEEIDLCWRMRSRGFKIMVNPQSTVYHVGGGTLSKTNPYKTYLNFRNSLLMLYKNMEGWPLFKVLMVRSILDGAAGLHLTLTQGHRHGMAVGRAYRDFFNMRKGLSNKALLASKLPMALQEKKVFSIVLTYYLGRKKIFSKL